MSRREFISLLGAAAATWPLESSAQQSDRVRRIGVLMAATMDDPEYQAASRRSIRADSLARPGGNATGFTVFEYGMSGKWLELLKQLAPNLTRAAVLRDPTIASGIGQFAAVQAVGTLA